MKLHPVRILSGFLLIVLCWTEPRWAVPFILTLIWIRMEIEDSADVEGEHIRLSEQIVRSIERRAGK